MLRMQKLRFFFSFFSFLFFYKCSQKDNGCVQQEQEFLNFVNHVLKLLFKKFPILVFAMSRFLLLLLTWSGVLCQDFLSYFNS